MHPEYHSAKAFDESLHEIIAEFGALAPDLIFEDKGEQVVTVVCDCLKSAIFADEGEAEHWQRLRVNSLGTLNNP